MKPKPADHPKVQWRAIDKKVFHEPQSMRSGSIICDTPERASFIVQACNNHEGLLEACKSALNGINLEPENSGWDEIIKDLEKAIANAESK